MKSPKKGEWLQNKRLYFIKNCLGNIDVYQSHHNRKNCICHIEIDKPEI